MSTDTDALLADASRLIKECDLVHALTNLTALTMKQADTIERLTRERADAKVKERERCAAYCDSEGLFKTAAAIRAYKD